MPRAPKPAGCRRWCGIGHTALVVGMAGVLVGFLAGGQVSTATEEEQPRRTQAAVLDLSDGGFVAGEWLATPPGGEGDGGEPRPAEIRWQADDFARPFTFPLSAIRGIRFREPAAEGVVTPGEQGNWRLELAGGDEIVGRLVSIDGEHVVIDAEGSTRGRREGAVATVRVKRNHVRSIRRATGRDLLPPGAPLALWRQTPAESWRDEGGRVVTDRRGTLYRDCEPPQRCRYDIAVSWVGRPAVEIGFDVEDDGPAPYRLLLGAAGIVAVRDEGRGTGPRAALDSVGPLPESRFDVAVFVDRVEGRLAVLLPGADGPAVDVRVPPTAGRSTRGLRLSVTQGTVAIDGLRMSPWQGDVPRTAAGGKGEVRLDDGTILAGTVVTMDAATGTLEVDPAPVDGGAGRAITVDRVESIVLPNMPPDREAASTGPRPGRSVRIVDRHGSRFSGTLDRLEQGVVWVDCAGIDGRLSLPIDTLAAIMSREPPIKAGPPPGRVGRILSPHSAHRGRLVPGVDADGGPAAGRAAVAWQPLGSLTASPLTTAVQAGEPEAAIDYVERTSVANGAASEVVAGIGCQIAVMDGRPMIASLLSLSAARGAGVEPGDRVLAVAARGDGRFVDTEGLSIEDVQHLLRGRAGSTVQLRLARGEPPENREVASVRRPMPQLGRNPQLLRAALEVHDRLAPAAAVAEGDDEPAESLLFLRTGERVGCVVESVGEAGIVVRLPGREPVPVPNEAVRALELVPNVGRPITAEKFRSLTTLPRFQESAPPTHLVRSPAGDYLRGRVVSLDDRTLRIAVEANPRGRPLDIPREQVARVIWLHPEEIDFGPKPENGPSPLKVTEAAEATEAPPLNPAAADGLAVEAVTLS
ncbi:MAG: hypothetical protein ACKOTB_09195, partial [Planctomycetia bacterium]